MEFDWLEPNFDLKKISPKEIEETFEDPFAIKMLPDGDYAEETRFFCLGKTVGGRGFFNVFWTDGKQFRVILAREMTDEEQGFYERHNAELIA